MVGDVNRDAESGDGNLALLVAILGRKPTLSVTEIPKNHNYASRASNSILGVQSGHPLVATNDDKAPRECS